MAESMIEADGVALCTEPFGDPADPPILLVMGVGGSMLWWEDGFCRMLADGRRFVIRYDHRDTGRSVTYEPATPPTTAPTWSLTPPVCSTPMDFPRPTSSASRPAGPSRSSSRSISPIACCSLVLISTSPATPGDRGLPPPTEEFGRFVATAEVDWTDAESVIEYLVGYSRVLNGSQRPFDEAASREFVRRDVERAHNIAALQNHDDISDDDRSRGPCPRSRLPRW